MALAANQQTQYNQLISAGASPTAAMNAAMLVPTAPAASTSTSTGPNLSFGATNTQQPAAAAPISPAPQIQTPPAPMATQPAQMAPQASQPTTSPVQQSNTTTASPTRGQATQGQPPQIPNTGNLAPGMQGQNVQDLQNYLIQMGYLTPEQVSGGQGTYGPQTTAAVAALQRDLGINTTTGSGSFGPQTQQALAQKYQSLYSAVKGTDVPSNGALASSALSSNLAANSTDPVFSSMAKMMEPIMQSLTQVLSNINNPALTNISLQQEYSDLAAKYNVPALQSQMLNMTNIMNGTEQDIRDEITSAGGFATDSQVLAMTAARNRVIQKQYNTIATQYQAAQTNIQNMMQYASEDRQSQLQRDQLTASVTQNLASIETQMAQMSMTMMNNTRSSLQSAVTNMGYKGLAASAQGNPQVLSYYENVLGLAPGSMSNPKTLASMDTYKDQQLQINSYKAAISAFNAGYGGGIGNANNPGYGGPVITQGNQVGITPVDASTLTRPPWLSVNVPLTLSANEMEQYMATQKAATLDKGTNNVIAPGVGYYVHQADGSYVLKAAMPTDLENQYNSIKQTIASAPPFQGSPVITRKWSLTTNAAIKNFEDLGTYKVVSNIAPYLANIRAASENPGSVGDLELLDSYVRASKGGTGQVTDTQVNTILRGASIADSWSVLQQKLQNGGVLSPNQRQQLISLASNVYKENANDFQKIYVQAMQNLQGQGVPVSFWGNFPDLNSLMTQ